MAIKTTRIRGVTFKRPSWEYQAVATLSYIITSLFGGLPDYNNFQVKTSPITDLKVYSVEHVGEKEAGGLELKFDEDKKDLEAK